VSGYWEKVLKVRLTRRSALAAGLTATAAAVLAACSGDDGDRTAGEAERGVQSTTRSSTFVLVHAAWLGAWSWDALLPHLAGHKVVAVDLPGHGKDKTPISDVTMEGYVRAVTDALDANGPAVLVGHSVGGLVISQAAEARPDRVTALAYVAGFLLPNGASFVAATEGVQGSMVLDNLVFAQDGQSVTVRPEAMHQAFAHDVPLEAFQAVAPLVVPEPTAPLATPLALTEANWGRVPRYYVECLQDRAIPPAVQEAMYTALPVRQVFSMQTSHSPNFAAPEELARHLQTVAAAV
jgi:pimeloyl-ACP methyl ester carboxylesterase